MPRTLEALPEALVGSWEGLRLNSYFLDWSLGTPSIPRPDGALTDNGQEFAGPPFVQTVFCNGSVQTMAWFSDRSQFAWSETPVILAQDTGIQWLETTS